MTTAISMSGVSQIALGLTLPSPVTMLLLPFALLLCLVETVSKQPLRFATTGQTMGRGVQ